MGKKTKASEKPKILTTKSAVIYGLGILGVQLFIGYMNSFQMEFYNKMYSAFDGKIFYAASIIILLAKLISCIADPVIGALIDKSNLKGGKIKPWILFSSVPIAVMTTVIFIYIPFKSKLFMYLYITLTTVLWNISMSFADIPSQGMLSLLSPVAEERNFAAGIANIFKTIGLAAAGIIVTVVMMVLGAVYPDGYPDRLYYLVTALFLLVVGTALYLLIYFCSKETVKSTSSESFSFKEMFVELKTNKMMLIIFLTYILGFARTMALGIIVQAGGALVGKVYFPGLSELFAGGGELDPTSNATWLIGITGGVVGLIGVVVAPIVNKKFGEKKTFIGFAVYGGIVSAVSFAAYLFMPEGSPVRSGIGAVIFIWIIQFFVSFMFSPNNLLPPIMTSDTVDYIEWKTGKRKEGVCFAILSMAIKVSNALAVAVGILLIGISGYIDGVEVTVKMQNIVMFAYIAMPGISTVLSMIPMFFYKIDEKTKKQMRLDLEKARTKK